MTIVVATEATVDATIHAHHHVIVEEVIMTKAIVIAILARIETCAGGVVASATIETACRLPPGPVAKSLQF